MAHQTHHVKLNPYAPVSAADLATIVASHDLLQAWNNLNENALKAEGKVLSAQLISNIQSTAAFIVQTQKIVASQNFELMRALNLYDQTLSPTDIAQGFFTGVNDKLTDVAKQAMAFTEPADMRLQHAQARTDALLKKPQKIANAISQLWQHPNTIPATFQAELSGMRNQMAQNMVGEHAGLAIGNKLGAAVASITINSISLVNKGKVITNVAESTTEKPMAWHDYATLVGGGLHPPPLKPMRDFSDEMRFLRPYTQYGQSRVTYEPSLSHKIIAEIHPGYGMTYLIKALDDREKYGSDTELFLSAMKKFQTHGVEINRIKSTWDKGELGTNWQQFINARQAGETVEHAVKHTFGGKMAGKLGLTSVNIKKVNPDITALNDAPPNTCSKLYPVFNRPYWGNNATWNDYANNWVLSQGRAELTVTPIKNTGMYNKINPSIPGNLLQQVEQLPANQQEIILKKLQANFATITDTSAAIIKKTKDSDIDR